MDYERGLNELKRLAQGTDWYQEFLRYEVALRDRLDDERYYGTAPQTKQEMMRTIDHLNTLSLKKLQVSFTDLCQGKTLLQLEQTLPDENKKNEASEDDGAISIFYCYAPEDRDYCRELEKQLAVMKRFKLIKSWYGQDIKGGEQELGRVQQAFTSAQIALLMVSPDLLASDIIYEKQVQPILERWKQGLISILPILVRGTEGWELTEFGDLTPLPKNRRPVVDWGDRTRQEKAWLEVAKGIREVAQSIKDARENRAKT